MPAYIAIKTFSSDCASINQSMLVGRCLPANVFLNDFNLASPSGGLQDLVLGHTDHVHIQYELNPVSFFQLILTIH